MSEVVNVAVDKIDPNHYRNLQTYPVIRAKVDALKASMKTVGVWPSIVVRNGKGGRYEQAFGHQRLAAAKELGLSEVPVITMDLTDEQMIQYMGRENGEDYGTDVLVLLNTWEAAVNFFGTFRKISKAIDIARVLGWLETGEESSHDRMNMAARTCSAALALINDGHLKMSDIDGIPVSAAFNIVERVTSRVESLERMAKQTGRPAHETEQAKKHIYKGAKQTAKDVREGAVAARDVRHQVDVNAFGSAKGTQSTIPLFKAFGKSLTDQIDRTLRSDIIADRLAQIVEALPQITLEEDFAVVRQIKFDLNEVANRAKHWDRKLITDKVVKLAPLEDKRGA